MYVHTKHIHQIYFCLVFPKLQYTIHPLSIFHSMQTVPNERNIVHC